jgi:glycosyltransferase involved in cell wall biosynthesis
VASSERRWPASREADHLTHLLICREYPPAAYPPGGIGTYARHIAALLVEAGERVHVIAHRWAGAPECREVLAGGRLVVHRVALDDPPPDTASTALPLAPAALLASPYPIQAFAWQAALRAEQLVAEHGIDVIEAQEWEAPLAYFQLRRAAGLGPSRRPPCVVHVHSPTARIFAANRWDTSVADYEPAAALEAYTLRAAEAVLCPSRFIADETIARYGLDPTRVTVIPYPRGDMPAIDRPPEVWASDAICHVGRLEPRKGVLEWAEAIAAVAPDHPEARFDFIGTDTPLAVTGGPGVRQAMLRQVPRRLRRQLRFLGTQERAGVTACLGRASAAVVPSRWENFPFSCIEAMSSGLPVLVSPNGGMRELVADGVTGWIAPSATPDGLAEGLRRVLATPADVRRRMGEAAALAVRRLCDGERIVEQHLAMKRRIAPADAVARRIAADESAWPTIVCEPAREAAAVEQARACARDPRVRGVALVDAEATLAAGAVATCAAWLDRDPSVGLVAAWTRSTSPADTLVLAPVLARPYALEGEVAAPFVLVRAEALRGTSALTRLGVFDQVVAAGAGAAMYPEPLSTLDRLADSSLIVRRYSSMTLAVQRLHTPMLQWLRTCGPEARRRFLIDGLRRPGQSARWLAERAGRIWRARRPAGASPPPPASERSVRTGIR